MAGRVQIEALGQLSDFLTVEPSFSFFTKRYSKYTNYANENYKISYPMRVYTDDFLDVRIPQNCGDILQEVTLSFTMDSAKIAEMGSNISPIDVFGISTIEYVDLYVGDQKIDTVTSDDIFIDRELNIPESYRSSIDVIHGKHFQGSSDREFLQEFYDGQFSTQGIDQFDANEYRIQIPFYFHRRPAHGFPLCALRKQELSLRIKIRQTNDLLFVSQEKFGDNLWDPRANNQVTDPIELCNFKVNLGVVHLDMVERCMLQNKPIDIHFEQRQRNTFLIDAQSKVGDFRLDFKNCVKELYFIAKKTGKWTDENISILDQLRELDGYTSEQQTTLTILKLIPVWSGIIANELEILRIEPNTTTRTELINAVLNLFYWGTDDTYTSILESLKTPSEDDQTKITTIQTYLYSIPGTILGIQANATTLLNSLIPLTNQEDIPTRIGIVQQLLAIENLWGPEQIGILNALQYPEILRPPEAPSDDLLIFGLRVYLTTASYYLPGLSQLKPGTPEQVATINKVTEIFDNTKAAYDILKIGLKGVLDDIPGKTGYIRSRIVYALIRSGTFTLGQDRGIWSQTQLVKLNSLTVDPGSNVILIAEQRATIDSLIAFLDSLDDIKGFISEQLTLLDGELNYDTRDDIINNLVNLVNFYISSDNILDLDNPKPFWSQTEIDFLEDLRNPNLGLAGTATEDNYIGILTTYANTQTVSDSLFAKNTIDGLLDAIIAYAGDQETRATLVEALLDFDVPDRPYWDETTRVLINELGDDTLPADHLTNHIPAIRVYMNAIVYGLRLIIAGMTGQTGIEYTIDRLLTLLDGETDVPTRTDLVNGLLAIPGIWRQTEIDLLDELKDSGTPLGGTATEDTYILALRIQSNTISFNIAAGIIPTGFPGATLEERIANVTVLRLLPVWEDTTIKLVNEWYGSLDTIILNLGTYINGLDSSLDYIVNGIDTTLGSLPGTEEDRTPIIDSILDLENIWGASQEATLEALKTPSVSDDATRIATITGYIDGRIALYDTAVGYLEPTNKILASEVDTLKTYAFWGTDQVTVLSQLEALVDTRGPSGTVTDAENEYKNDLNLYVKELRFYWNLVEEGISSTVSGIATVTNSVERGILVGLLINFTIWDTHQLTLLNELRTVDYKKHSTLVNYLTGKLGSIPILKFRLNVLKAGINGILDDLPSTAVERDPIILGITTLHTWSDTQFYFLNKLRTPSDADLIYIIALKISTGSLDSLTTDPEGRDTIVDDLKSSPFENFWTSEQTELIETLSNSDNDATTIPALNALVTPVPIMTGYTQFDQNNIIDGLISETIWGEKYFDLNDLRQIEPRFVGQATVISQLGTYLSGLPPSFIVIGIYTTLDYLPGLGEQRTEIIGGLLTLDIWESDQRNILTQMLTSSANDAENIDELKGYIDGIITIYDNTINLLSPINTLTSEDVTTIASYPFWPDDQGELLDQLGGLVLLRENTSAPVTDAEIFFKGILDLYTRGIRFYWNVLKDGVATTVSNISTVSNSTERNILVDILVNFPIWGAAQLTLLRELRTVDSKNHVDAIDAIVGYLDTVSAAIPGLLIDLETPSITSADLIDTDLKKAVWGGYFYYLLEALQNPAITTGTEAGIITKLSTHANISQSSESRTNNLNFLIKQLLNTYPETIFNKWVRAKKNVPLMYSKLKSVKLECDGVQILDEITGSNMFLSASLPNLYHKRSPNFRNINIYSFALYPQDLQPSGHLNFSTVKDANLYMELQYDGAHGTYDFDDNYISLFGIDPIYFPKQVIIIAKSYNMMIIRDGVARIIF